jgi:hypothetical protein
MHIQFQWWNETATDIFDFKGRFLPLREWQAV